MSETRSDSTGARSESPPAVDAVELALADALARASAAGQWSTVEVLARELEARRSARSCGYNVVVPMRRRTEAGR